MKVILKAWNLQSPVQEWPEGTGPIIKIPMFQGRVKIGDYFGKEVAHIAPREDIAEFEWDGTFIGISTPLGERMQSAKVYVLRSIVQR